MKKLGFIVNPYAGVGGMLALKGSDGIEIVDKALEMGAEKRSASRAIVALTEIKKLVNSVEIITPTGEMGELEAIECGFTPTVVCEIDAEHRTTAEDTKAAAALMIEQEVDLILFAGGDGTARDIYDAVGVSVPVVGIPTGTKMHSGIYAVSPKAAGRLASQYLNGETTSTRELEVMDIDEAAFREGDVKAKLYGFLQVPNAPNMTQGVKGGGHVASEGQVFKSIASEVIRNMEPDVYYIIGSGTTVRAIMNELDLPNTLLGVDVVRNKELIASDVSEKQLLEIIGDEPARIIVTVIGGQGFIFGRGNQQISYRVINKVGKENIIIVATEPKLSSIPDHKLKIDTGDSETDRMLAGPARVCAGAYGTIFMQCVPAD